MRWLAFALLFVGGCELFFGHHHSHEYTSVSRARGCVSNLNSIDKCVGVWESQNVAIPMDRETWIEVDSRGRVTRVSPTVTELMKRAEVPARVRLAPGSTVLFDYVKDLNVFRCMSRVHAIQDEVLDKNPETHYRWVSSPEPREELRGRKRGVICLLHHDVGPRDRPDAVHRPL
jgi:hypothetical protein